MNFWQIQRYFVLYFAVTFSKNKVPNLLNAVAHERTLIAWQRFFRSGQSVSLHFPLCFCCQRFLSALSRLTPWILRTKSVFTMNLTRRSIWDEFWALRRKKRLRLDDEVCRLSFFQARSKVAQRQALKARLIPKFHIQTSRLLLYVKLGVIYGVKATAKGFDDIDYRA